LNLNPTAGLTQGASALVLIVDSAAYGNLYLK
jgi:hypothetical protein